MRSFFTGIVTLLAAAAVSSGTEAQTLRVLKSLDAPHYDGQRTTWSPTSDIVNMFQDTLVALDWDGKTAILVFNRGPETSTALAGIDATAKAHANFKRAVHWPHESGFRYVFHANGDTNRELILTLLVFHVPK